VTCSERCFFERLWFVITHLSQTHLLTLGVGAVSLALLVGLERLSRRIPAALVVLVLGVGVAAVLGLHSRGVAVVGNIPAGLAPPRLPDVSWKDLLILIPGAAGIALVGFAEAIGPARMFASRHGYEVDANRELVGLGAANIGAGLFQGFADGCSLSKSAANDEVGARTQLSSMVAAGLTVLVALFLAPLFRTLPEATLAAIVIVAVSGMMDVRELARLWRLSRPDILMALTALMGVLLFDVLPGLIIAVGLSLLLLIYRASLPRISEVGRIPGTTDLAAVHREPSAITLPGLLVLRPEENLFFANETGLHDEVLRRIREAPAPVKEVLLDLELTEGLDVPGADMLRSLHEDLTQRGIVLSLARVHAPTRRMLERSGVLEKVGADHLYPQVSTGVEAWLVRNESQTWQEWRLIRDGLRQFRVSVDEAGSTLHGEDRRHMEELQRRLDDAASELRELLRRKSPEPPQAEEGPAGPPH
jgi:sulfate permease, SulP family